MFISVSSTGTHVNDIDDVNDILLNRFHRSHQEWEANLNAHLFCEEKWDNFIERNYFLVH